MSESGTEWAWPWWITMVTINIVSLIIGAYVFKKSKSQQDEGNSKYLKRMRIMGIIFALVGTYRAIFVSEYGPQRAWFDTIANSALLIRLFAIAAELSFSGLIAYSMLKFTQFIPILDKAPANKFKSFIFTKSPYILVICIFLAQFFATSGVITKSELVFAIEETLWFVGFLSILPLAIIQVHHVFSLKEKEQKEQFIMLRRSSLIVLLWCVIYICFGLFLNLPALWVSAFDQLNTGIPVIQTGTSAIINAFTIVNVSRLYSDWGFGFLFWHSGYFSVCVWISIYLMQAPRPKEISGDFNLKRSRIILILIVLTLLALFLQIILPIL